MSLFTKTVVVRGGMSQDDAQALIDGLETICKTIAERFEEAEKRIDALEAQVSRLRIDSHRSLRAKLKEKNYPDL